MLAAEAERVLPDTLVPASKSLTVDSVKGSRRQKKSSVSSTAPVSIKSGAVSFCIDPSISASLEVRFGPLIVFKTQPSNYLLLHSINWNDESQAVRHAYTATTSHADRDEATLRRLSTRRGGPDVK